MQNESLESPQQISKLNSSPQTKGIIESMPHNTIAAKRLEKEDNCIPEQIDQIRPE